MELNYDCFRQVLITLEEKLTFIHYESDGPYHLTFPMLGICDLGDHNRLSGFSAQEILYAVYNLEQAGYIAASIINNGLTILDCEIRDITFTGHMFLKNIRDDGVWKKVKAGLGRVGGASLSIVTDLALSYIRQQVGLP